MQNMAYKLITYKTEYKMIQSIIDKDRELVMSHLSDLSQSNLELVLFTFTVE